MGDGYNWTEIRGKFQGLLVYILRGRTAAELLPLFSSRLIVSTGGRSRSFVLTIISGEGGLHPLPAIDSRTGLREPLPEISSPYAGDRDTSASAGASSSARGVPESDSHSDCLLESHPLGTHPPSSSSNRNGSSSSTVCSDEINRSALLRMCPSEGHAWRATPRIICAYPKGLWRIRLTDRKKFSRNPRPSYNAPSAVTVSFRLRMRSASFWISGRKNLFNALRGFLAPSFREEGKFFSFFVP